MIKFIPETLKDKVESAIEKLSFLSILYEDQNLLKFVKDENDEEIEFKIDKFTELTIEMDDDIDPVISVADLLYMANNLDDMKIDKKQSYALNKEEAYFLIDNIDFDTMMKLNHIFYDKTTEYIKPKELLAKEVVIEGEKYSVSLFNGFCMYHLLVQKSGNYNRDLSVFYIMIIL